MARMGSLKHSVACLITKLHGIMYVSASCCGSKCTCLPSPTATTMYLPRKSIFYKAALRERMRVLHRISKSMGESFTLNFILAYMDHYGWDTTHPRYYRDASGYSRKWVIDTNKATKCQVELNGYEIMTKYCKIKKTLPREKQWKWWN